MQQLIDLVNQNASLGLNTTEIFLGIAAFFILLGSIYFPIIRNDCLPAVTKTGGGSIRPYVNYVTGLIACTIPRKSILSKITYTCQKRGLNQEKINTIVREYLENY